MKNKANRYKEIRTDNYFGDDILDTHTGEIYQIRYNSFVGYPTLKKVFEVSKKLKKTLYKVWRNNKYGNIYYTLNNGNYTICELIDGRLVKKEFSTIDRAIDYAYKLQRGEKKKYLL